MQKNQILTFTVITVLIGFMLAVQYQSANSDTVRDTRSLWELRQDYATALELQTQLLQEIRENDEKIAEYETESVRRPETVLFETLEELRDEAGLKEITGPGITLTLNKATEFIVPGQNEVYVSPGILRKLINEVNMYGAKAISIAGQRVIASTVIREIQGETKIDGYPLRIFPIEIKLLTEDMNAATKLYSRMQISTIADDFILDNIRVSISEPAEELVIPAYTNRIELEMMEPVNEEGGI